MLLRPRFKFIIALLGTLLIFAVGNCSQAQTSQGQSTDSKIENLFNGTSLEGWEGDRKYWSVQNGAIVGTIPKDKPLDKNTWLIWKSGELRDFDLNMQVQLSGAPGANSGIQYRCQVKSIDHVSGYQADFDMGATWLGRIYDEHGRALLVERGTRVRISPDGTRKSETFAPASQYAVLFREEEWNDYRIVAQGDHVAIYINGTLFSELIDQQSDQKELVGSLALQLHSGPETTVKFRNIKLETLTADDQRLKPFEFKDGEPKTNLEETSPGLEIDLGFEKGTLRRWSATGGAFKDQPVNKDGITARWPGVESNKNGDFFIGGFEVVGDAGTGTLTSERFETVHPYGSFLIGGGKDHSTRVEIIVPATDDQNEEIIFTAVGENRESMRRVAVDLRKYLGQFIAVRLVDENTGGWGHLNFDDFRFHSEPPVIEPAVAGRSIRNPILHHLVPNKLPSRERHRGEETTGQMYVPNGFSVDVIAAEPSLHQPMAFTFDAKGRLWVVEGYTYPQKRPEGEGLDRVLIFSDDDGNGSFETRKVFCEGLNLVSGMEVGHGGVWIGAAPQLLFIPDANGDDIPDGEPQVLLDGFGFADTHETMNSFMWGPDGWLYGNQGVFNTSMIGKPGTTNQQRKSLSAGVWRYHPTRHLFEVFAHGGSNQWGLDYDQFGQIFMTHCRSFWGKGSTTHVIQGGHYWNQVNGGYAPFISSTELSIQPAMKNYLLASARYGHGEGGAGKPGSKAVYGGHSHVGTMIYLGDNWPAEFHNHLFSHNLHGHQINHQINLRESGGFNTVHAGHDVLFCEDPQFIGVDLKVGPDGAVYMSDWYDPRHCHNPNWEHWDRGNGRIYRMKFDETYHPANIDYSSVTDDSLVEAQLASNAWHARIARLELSNRASSRAISINAINQLEDIATAHLDSTRRLRAIWALHVTDAIKTQTSQKFLTDPSEYVRAWAIQLAVEKDPPKDIQRLLIQLAEQEPSLLVRRYLASAIQRVPPESGWKIAEKLSIQSDIGLDRELPLLLWYGIAYLMENDLERALQLADRTNTVELRDYVFWYAAKMSEAGREAISGRIADLPANDRVRLLSLFEFGLRGMRGLKPPATWASVSDGLYDSDDVSTRRAAESLGAAFGDQSLFERMRNVLKSDSGLATKLHALAILANDPSDASLPDLLPLLSSPRLAKQVLPMLTRYNDPAVATALLQRMPNWQEELRALAFGVLSSRVDWANQLLDAVDRGDLEKSGLTAFYARQMANLGDSELRNRLELNWGRLGTTSDERRSEIADLVQTYQTAPLWAYSAKAGAAHFKTHCATCHQETEASTRIAPRLQGSGAKGIDYIIENIVDPNAVIGRDFQARIILTIDGRVISGLVMQETDSAFTVRTATSTEVVAKNDVEETQISKNSFMPESLLSTLNERERIELLKYLMSL